MTNNQLEEARLLRAEIDSVDWALKAWERAEEAWTPGDLPGQADPVHIDRDAWGLYRQACIHKLIRHKAELTAKFKAL